MPWASGWVVPSWCPMSTCLPPTPPRHLSLPTARAPSSSTPQGARACKRRCREQGGCSMCGKEEGKMATRAGTAGACVAAPRARVHTAQTVFAACQSEEGSGLRAGRPWAWRSGGRQAAWSGRRRCSAADAHHQSSVFVPNTSERANERAGGNEGGKEGGRAREGGGGRRARGKERCARMDVEGGRAAVLTFIPDGVNETCIA